jgi:thiol-disulfide isomerase/thioredoxin
VQTCVVHNIAHESNRLLSRHTVQAANGKLGEMKTIFSLILLCLAGTTSLAFAKPPGEVNVGDFLREAQMQGLSGPSKKLSAFRGKHLVISVWASWCGPCREEIGSLERLSRRYGGKQFNVIGISTDDYRDRATAFLRQSHTTFTNFIDSNLFMENMLGADRLPLTLLVDSQGRVLGKFYGAKQWDSPEALEIIAKAFRTKM